ncbi:MAG: threonine--tRNA ligase [Methylacidiphilales bacterium]|nr:threonine--tRNA ligase [Candidatus Methylacidiphilales bacterium]MDW8349026.1 threonine--tRNA ligase [Verrucomicrobiae bacterium]
MAHQSLENDSRMTELERIRHSCAHVMATAISRLWPDAQFAYGPPVENGFYYDLECSHRITPEDFPAIEAEMKKEIRANHPFERIEVSREQAITDAMSGRLGSLSVREGQPSKYKLDLIQQIPEGEVITYYRNGDFIDLCAGPHVMRTGEIGAFKLTSVASAYYKGDERNPQLQRIYGTAFKTKAELDAYFAMIEEAKKRDHRRLGAELSLYVIDAEYVGAGLPLWLPNGTVLVEELEKLAKETEFRSGYQRVRTPHIAREKMYVTSGHLPYYADSMFPPIVVSEGSEQTLGNTDKAEKATERYYLKAMNCPHHHRIFAAQPRSYRDLPLRLAEYGCCYRYEQSGELFGLMRVRSLNMNDAHIYCTEEQFAEEFRAVNEMYLHYFKIFGFQKYVMRFSTHDPTKLGQKYVNEPELWLKTEAMVRQVLIDSGIPFVEVPNEAAFYGPKIDVQVWSAVGREFTIATNQVDFAVPKRFGLTYRDRDNTEKTPLCIHRAPLGTHERFIGFLIEHYAGNFPLWLSPEQVRILTIGVEEPLLQYARGIESILIQELVRVRGDYSSDPIKAKIANAEKAHVHTMLIIGPRDLAEGKVSVRLRGKGPQGALPKDKVIENIISAISERRPD